jgi:hypothetical protein
MGFGEVAMDGFSRADPSLAVAPGPVGSVGSVGSPAAPLNGRALPPRERS